MLNHFDNGMPLCKLHWLLHRSLCWCPFWSVVVVVVWVAHYWCILLQPVPMLALTFWNLHFWARALCNIQCIEVHHRAACYCLQTDELVYAHHVSLIIGRTPRALGQGCDGHMQSLWAYIVPMCLQLSFPSLCHVLSLVSYLQVQSHVAKLSKCQGYPDVSSLFLQNGRDILLPIVVCVNL